MRFITLHIKVSKTDYNLEILYNSIIFYLNIHVNIKIKSII